MEETSLRFKPIVWRLVIWKSIPFCIGVAIGILIDWLIDKSISSFWIVCPLGALVGGIITASVLYYTKALDINISKNKISGPSTGFAVRQSFSITDLDKESPHKQSILENMFVGKVLQSFKGEKTIFMPFIYRRSAVTAIQELMGKDES